MRGNAGVALLSVSVALALAACGTGSTTGASSGSTTVPQVVMTDAMTGYAVWPSGVRWIVLGTKDGWRTVTNRTPVAVPNDGGLVLAAREGHVVVGVLPFQQLTVSPVLSSDGTTRQWAPGQLPAALAATPRALARSDASTWAVLSDGRVVTSSDPSTSWTTSTSARALDPSGNATITGVGFPDGHTGFLTSTGGAAGPVLFVTTDSGRSWLDSGLRAHGVSVSSWLPCRIGSTWAVPVEVDDHLVVATSPSATGPWALGPAAPVTGAALVTCTPSRVLAGVRTGATEQIYAASPGGAWSSVGQLDSPLGSLTAVSDDHVFATDDGSRMLDVDLTSPIQVTDIALPGWVASIGGPSMRS